LLEDAGLAQSRRAASPYRARRAGCRHIARAPGRSPIDGTNARQSRSARSNGFGMKVLTAGMMSRQCTP
jgi:hypothetical protein